MSDAISPIRQTPAARPKIEAYVRSHLVSPTNEVLVRYEGHSQRWEGGGEEHRIIRYEFPVMRRTKHCDVIDDYGRERFVNRNARKRFAYPTDEAAKVSFKCRLSFRTMHAEWAIHSTAEITKLAYDL